jgi:hypothetical protein
MLERLLTELEERVTGRGHPLVGDLQVRGDLGSSALSAVAFVFDLVAKVSDTSRSSSMGRHATHIGGPSLEIISKHLEGICKEQSGPICRRIKQSALTLLFNDSDCPPLQIDTQFQFGGENKCAIRT